MASLRRDAFGYLMILVVASLVLIPVLFLIYGSFSPESVPSNLNFSRLTLQNYGTVYHNPVVYQVLSNTLIYIISTAVLGTLTALVLAYLVERTDMPAKSLIYGLVLAGFGIPGMIQAIAWELLADPRAGILNLALHALFPHLGALDINTMAGMVFVQSIQNVPIGFLMFLPLFRNMDPSLEEAALTVGASNWQSARTVTLKLLTPGIAAVLIYQVLSSLEVFEIPGILGLPGHIYVFSTLLYSIVNATGSLPAYNQASALSIIMLVMAGIGIWLYFRVLQRANRYATVTGRAFRPRRRALKAWRPVALGLALVYVLIAVILPFLMLLYASFEQFLQVPSIRAIEHFTWSHYQFAGIGIDLSRVLANTVWLVIAAATLTVLLAFATSYLVIRSQFRWRRTLDLLAFMPHGVPGIVAGVAFFWIFINLGPLFGTVWSMAIAFAMVFIAYGTRVMNAAFIQIHPELEEAGRVAGLPRWRTVTRIVMPLVKSSMFSLWILVLLMAVRVAGLPIMLYSGQKSLVLSVMIWNLWNSGNVQAAAAMGSILMLVVFLLMAFSQRLGGPNRHLA